MANPKIVRNRLKIKASVLNARIFRAVCLEYGSFFNFIKKFMDGYLCKIACAKSGTENADNIEPFFIFVAGADIFGYPVFQNF